MIICACYEQLTRVFAHFGLTEDEKRWKSEKQMKLRIMVITLMTLTTECSAPAINLNDVKFVRTSVFWLIYVGLHLIIFFRNCGTSIVAQRILRFSFLFNSFIFFFWFIATNSQHWDDGNLVVMNYDYIVVICALFMKC